MTISLVEEFLLLSLDDQGGEFADIPETSLSCGTAGAALMDLAIRGKIDSDLTSLWAVDTTPTDSEILNRILTAIASEKQKLDARSWIRRMMPETMKVRAEALNKLCERGILRQHEHKFLWVTKGRSYPVEKDTKRLEVEHRVLDLIFNQEIPALVGDQELPSPLSARPAAVTESFICCTSRISSGRLGQRRAPPYLAAVRGQCVPLRLSCERLFWERLFWERYFGKGYFGKGILGKAILGKAILGKTVLGKTVLGEAILGEAFLRKGCLGKRETVRLSMSIGMARVGRARVQDFENQEFPVNL